MEYADGKLLANVENGIGTITFNNPEKRNAMSAEMWAGMADALDKFAADPAVRVLVLTGAGDKAFVSGADISQFEKRIAAADKPENFRASTENHRSRLATFPKPAIARIRGYCLGGGLGIAMQADIRIASDDSQFGIPAAKLGNAYSADSLANLVNLVGPAHARMLMYTGSRISAVQAERIGLVNQVVPVADLSNVVTEIAQTIVANAPLSVASSKISITQLVKDESIRDKEAMERAVNACAGSADFKEGRTAFMEKRKPNFKGA